jgi:hypothetical protein
VTERLSKAQSFQYVTPQLTCKTCMRRFSVRLTARSSNTQSFRLLCSSPWLIIREGKAGRAQESQTDSEPNLTSQIRASSSAFRHCILANGVTSPDTELNLS